MRKRAGGLLLAATSAALAGGAAVGAKALAGDEPTPLVALDKALPRAAEKAQPSVVALLVEREEHEERPLTQREKMQLGLGAMRVFDTRYFVRPPGACSGVVVRAEKGKPALVVTSGWNVRDAKTISVVLADGTKLAATPKGRDENLDIVVLEVAGGDSLVPIQLGAKPAIGQYTVLVGRGGDRANPIVTVGNVSALGRFKGDALQMTSRMNYGNVGGAVVDLDGKLLGIATRLTDRAGHGLNSGVGFAAPVTRLIGEIDALASGKVIGKRKSPFLGIGAAMDRRGNLVTKLPKGATRGVLIGQVIPGGAAEKSGIQPNDVIEIFNGVEVKDFLQLRDEIEKLEPGEKVIVTIFRAEKGEKDFTIALGARPEGEE